MVITTRKKIGKQLVTVGTIFIIIGFIFGVSTIDAGLSIPWFVAWGYNVLPLTGIFLIAVSVFIAPKKNPASNSTKTGTSSDKGPVKSE